MNEYIVQVNKLLNDSSALYNYSAYTERLLANTERTQAELVFLGYQLCGGTDTKMIARAGQAIEMLHAAVTCLDTGEDEAQARQALHQAEIILANLDTDPENKIKVLSITNRTLMLMARAQSLPDDDQVTYWRATECALNPLHVGMVLAGADCHATDAVTPATLAFGNSLLIGDVRSIQDLAKTLKSIIATVQ